MPDLLIGTESGVFRLERNRRAVRRRLVNERPVPDEVWLFAADVRVPGRLYL